MSAPLLSKASWTHVRSQLCAALPALYELEPGGALAMELERDGWMLEITPDGTLACQNGIAMDDVKSLTSDGTTEDIGTDELAKQAKYFLQPAVSKYRPALVKAGFEEQAEMNEEYVAVIFRKTVDLGNLEEVKNLMRWCVEKIR